MGVQLNGVKRIFAIGFGVDLFGMWDKFYSWFEWLACLEMRFQAA